MTVTVSLESPDQPEVAAFIAASDAFAASLYPAQSNHLVGLAALVGPTVRFLVARRPTGAVGCGALMLGHNGCAELKRMWVVPEERGRGTGRAILLALVKQARIEGMRVVRLETGIHQPEAIALYQSQGFSMCAPFDGYDLDPLSVFMETRIG